MFILNVLVRGLVWVRCPVLVLVVGVVCNEDRLSAGDLGVGQDEQCSQQRGRIAGGEPEFGEDTPVLQVGEGVFAGGPLSGDQLVGLLLCRGQRFVVGGLVAGDDDGTVGVGVQTDEAEVRDCAETGFPKPVDDLVVAGGDDLTGTARAGRRYSSLSSVI
ncbi:hypothetical protein [Streptomyces flaveolus]|uniref:hypothetical protein n=1 Tax=Streptomyces flaveolus TaxID=67297 RepID=UPI003F4D21FA